MSWLTDLISPNKYCSFLAMVVKTPNMVETISVLNVPDVIHIGYNLMDYIGSDITTHVGNVSNYVVITDNNLAPIYLPSLLSSIKSHCREDQRLLSRILPPGEHSKSRETKAHIEDFLLDNACTRDTCLIALGGGVIGDLVGYVASTFMRGVSFVQIPTSLLAMVDSSIGGKTAIDTAQGKNLIGTFWQPKRIYMDMRMLETLPKRELANGMAEVIKTAAISSEAEFAKLEKGRDRINAALRHDSEGIEPHELDSNRAFLADVVGASARFKAHVVTIDEREGGLRGLLNFGHSIGHAYEAYLSPKWLHGECVSLGLLHEAQLSHSLGHCSIEVVLRLKNCLQLYNLPVEFDATTKSKLFTSNVMNTMKVDKKNKGSQKRVVLLSQIGRTYEDKASDVPDDAVEAVLRQHITITSIDLATQPMDKANHQSSFTEDGLTDGEVMENFFSKFKCKIGTEVLFASKAGSSVPTDLTIPLFEYVVLPQNQNGNEDLIADLTHFLNIVEGDSSKNRHISPLKSTQSTFVVPVITSYELCLPGILAQCVEKADAIEFRVDHLQCLNGGKTTQEWVATAGTQLAYLRRMTKLPVIFTVRSRSQAGKFDSSQVDTYMELIKWAHRWACDYVDIEINTLSELQLQDIMKMNQSYPSSKIIASFHDPQHNFPWSSDAMNQVYQQAVNLFAHYKHQGVIKLVGFANSFWDNIELEQFRHRVNPNNDKELILINMGPYGKFSRVCNKFLSPATHPVLPSASAPGQLSVSQLSFIRKELSMDE